MPPVTSGPHPATSVSGPALTAPAPHHDEDGDDLDDTFDDESFDENEALRRIAKINEQQQLQHTLSQVTVSAEFILKLDLCSEEVYSGSINLVK